METTIQRVSSQVTDVQEKAVRTVVREKVGSAYWELAEFNRYGIMPWLLVFVVGSGAIAAALTYSSDWKLAVIVISTVLIEAYALALAPMKSLVIGSAITVALHLLMIFI